jgi:hypothetical protein
MNSYDIIMLVLFIVFVGLPLPFMPQSWILYNVMNSYNNIAVVRDSVYFIGLSLGINIVAVKYSAIVAKLTGYSRTIAMMVMLFIANIILCIGIVIMMYHSNEMPYSGIALLTASYTPVVIFVAMETCFVFFPNRTTVPESIYSQLPGLLLSLYNTYGVPISAISIATDDFNIFLKASLVCTIAVYLFITSFYISGYRKSKPLQQDQKSIGITFKEIGNSLLTDSTHIWIIINLPFPIIGMTINFGSITSGLINEPLDSTIVKEIAITGYIESTVVSQLVVLGISFIPIVWSIATNDDTKKKYSGTNWFIMNMMVWVYSISIISTMVCIGIGTETSLMLQSYIDSSLPISFFGVAYARYNTRNLPQNTPLIFAIGLAIASGISFINVPIQDAGWYKDPIGARCLIIIPCFISLVMVIQRLWSDSKQSKIVELTNDGGIIELKTVGNDRHVPIATRNFRVSQV